MAFNHCKDCDLDFPNAHTFIEHRHELTIDQGGYPVIGKRRMHAIVAEKALGRRLPKGAQVHHVDEDKTNFANNNLVICQDALFHHLLHYRTRAYDATGNADAVQCIICKQWDVNPTGSHLVKYPGGRHHKHLIHHRSCGARQRHELAFSRIADGLCRICGLPRGVNGTPTMCRQHADGFTRRGAAYRLRKRKHGQSKSRS
jgi:hypothetical protein